MLRCKLDVLSACYGVVGVCERGRFGKGICRGKEKM